MITIGLTGGIGSGKSTVAAMLGELGAPVIDADKVGHTIYEPNGPAYREVVAAFGKSVIAADGTIDRKKLGAIVFADPAQLKRLEGIVHPRMLEMIKQNIARLRADGEKKPIVIEAAILIEAKWNSVCDQVWLVVAERNQVIDRVEAQRGLKPQETEARIKAQLSDDERRKHATRIIDNAGSLDDLKRRVIAAWDQTVQPK